MDEQHKHQTHIYSSFFYEQLCRTEPEPRKNKPEILYNAEGDVIFVDDEPSPLIEVSNGADGDEK